MGEPNGLLQLIGKLRPVSGGLSVMTVGDTSPELARSLLGSGCVSSVYTVDSSSLARDAADVREKVVSKPVPWPVDVMYVGYKSYARMLDAVSSCMGRCTTVVGADFGCRDVVRAVCDIFGRPPDEVTTDLFWRVSAGSGAGAACSAGSVMRRHIDRVLLLTCPQGIDTRVSGAMAGFEGLGIADIVIPFLNPHNVFAHAELDRRQFANDGARRINVKNCLIGHYGMIKFALDAGWRGVMFVEDDCRFERDPLEFHRYIQALPVGSNAVLDHVGVKQHVFSSLFDGDASRMWAVLPGGTFFDNFGCYILTREAMGCLVEYFEHCGLDGYRWPVDAADRAWPHLTEKLSVYVPRVRLAVQNGGRSLINGKEV